MARGSSWSSTSKLTPGTRCGIYLRGLRTCAWCLAALGKDELHIDHVVSRAEGGSNRPANLVPSCAPCNWAREYGRIEARLLSLGIDPDDAAARVNAQRVLPIDRRAGNALAAEWYSWHLPRQRAQSEAQKKLAERRRAEQAGALGGVAFPFGALAERAESEAA